jgi:steroid 5-alpha reductase family enzyme
MQLEKKLIKSYLVCFFSYFSALVIIFLFWMIGSQLPILIFVLLADLIGTFLIFIYSTILKNASLYDPYWSVIPSIITIFYVFNSGSISLRSMTVTTLIIIWSIRLTYNWSRQWKGLSHEDWRYRDLRNKTGNKFWIINFVGIQLMPTLLVYLGSLSIYTIFYMNNQNLTILDIIAFIITLSAILFETVADKQLRNFIRHRNSHEEIINSGLWKYSRHPNYLGEIMFWWGLYAFSLATSLEFWWFIIGPIAITLLFLAVSIPLMEQKNMLSKPSYKEYRERVSKLIPWFKKKEASN